MLLSAQEAVEWEPHMLMGDRLWGHSKSCAYWLGTPGKPASRFLPLDIILWGLSLRHNVSQTQNVPEEFLADEAEAKGRQHRRVRTVDKQQENVKATEEQHGADGKGSRWASRPEGLASLRGCASADSREL